MNFITRFFKNRNIRKKYRIRVANEGDLVHAQFISDLIKDSAKQRGVGIAERSPEYISDKIKEGKGIIAIHKKDNKLAGFCYIESWEHQKFVAISGMIVAHSFRKQGISEKIKTKAFNLARDRWPKAQIFSITTNSSIMKMNESLGYHTVDFSQLTKDEKFWEGCSSCPFYDVLLRTEKTKCLCTAMVFPKPKRK